MGSGGNPTSLYEILFEYELSICDRFQISPFQLRRERFSEFLLLSKRLQKVSSKESSTDNKKGKNKNFIPVTDYKKS